MTQENVLRIAAVSDLHFGNPRIDASEMYQKLQKYFYPQAYKAHVIFVAGDTYDRLLTVNSKSYLYAMLFVNDLFRISDTTGCQIRILHGTYSHDRDQLDVFHTLATEHTRYKIIKEITIENLTDFRCNDDILDPACSLTVGYLPDNLPYRTVTEVTTHLNKIMTLAKCPSLDLLIGHGTFAHTMPPNIPLPPLTYTPETFASIVTGAIIMGHIHVHSAYKNIYYCGSFDRMSHNEEESKGYYTLTYNFKKWSAKFRANLDATPFVSLPLTEMDAAKVTRQYLDLVAKSIPSGIGYVRIIHPDPAIRNTLVQVSMQQFPHIAVIARAPKDMESKVLKVTDINLEIQDEVKPTKENLGELIYQFLLEKESLGSFTKEQVVEATNALLK